MRDMLTPVFGETGAVAAQFIITLIVVFALIAVVYWLVRRFTGGRFGSIARGRVPRLAIIDAMAIDNRRRLVLVRRDNAEHLILIGGPSDVLIEGPIRRVSPRHRPEQQAQQGPQPGEITIAPVAAAEQAAEATAPELTIPAEAAPEPEPPAAEAQPDVEAPPTGRSEEPRHYDAPPPPPPPPPLPRRQNAPAVEADKVPEVESAPVLEAKPPSRRQTSPSGHINGGAVDHASAQFTNVAQPTAVQPMANTGPDGTPVVDGEFPQPTQQEDRAVAVAEATPPEHEAVEESIEEDSGSDDSTAAKVSDLEREMAKLLGEIGTRRAT